jgi:acyl-homoserine-lactone acylase
VKSRRRLAVAVLAACGLASAAGSAQAYDATIKYTQYGIPHITGGNFGDLGYGYGYAFAKTTSARWPTST